MKVVMLDEMSNETKRKKEQAVSHSACLMFHAFKMKFSESRNNSLFNGWERTIKSKIREMRKILEDFPTARHYLKANLDFAYKDALKQYKDETTDRSDLVQGLQYLPKTCPWQVADLTKSVEEILSKL